VERLAAGLRDFDKLNAFLSWRLAAHPGDLGSLLRLAENYEALGQVESAIRLVRERLESTNEAGEDFELRTALAGLAQRAGDRELLLATLRDMDLRYGPDPARAARQAHVLEVAGRPSEAFDALVAALAVARLPDGLSAAQERESRYWASLAHLAEVMQRPALALEAHAQMLSLDTYDAQQLRDAATLLQTGSPSRAADLLAHGFRRFGEPGFAHAAVGAWFAAGQPGRVEAFLATLPEPMAGRIRADKGFLKQRAAYYQSVERLDEALADLIQVYRIAPGDMDNRAAMLWTLLAKRDARRLRAALDRWAEDARDNPALWGPFGASLLALDEPQRALPYFVWQARDSRDYLWWLAYADALDSAGRPDAAWQLRRRAWTELRNHPQPQRPADPVIRTRVLALAMRFSPADEARELLRALMRDVAGMVETEAPVVNDALTVGAAPTEERAGSPAQARRLAIALREEVARIDTLPPAVGDLVAPSGGAELRAMRVAASELIVSYLISREGNEAARGWLLSRYARDLAKPAWAELALALTRRDDEALDRLLATVSDWLPKLDQIEAQRRLGRFASAQTLAFDTATSRPDDDSAHQKLVEAVLSGAPSAGVSVSSERQGALAREIVRSDVAVRLDQHSKLYGFARRTAQSSGDPALLGTVPRRLRELGMGVRRIAPRGDWWIEGARRDGAGSATVLRLGVQHVIDPSIDVDAALALNETADESAALSAIGRRDALRLGAHWNISARDYLRVRLAAARLESHAGTRLGNTRRTAVEVGHRVRIASPDLTVRAVASHLDVDGTGASDDLVRAIVPAGVAEPDKVLLPASGAQLDLYVTAGMTTADSYTRALQPFAELGAHHNALTGGSVSLRAGVNTSLFGADQLTLFAAYSRETTGAGKGTHELGLAYRLYY
jgi:tetratricopeptide (TPR) repeat protein